MLVGLYPRVSTTEQAENGHSIDEQIERMKKYCDAMGWTVYKVYTDAGFSGANTERPALQRMIKDVENGKLDKVLVYKLDRLSRSQLDTLFLIEKVFLANNTDFVSMSENFDTSTPFGRAMIGILAVFAQLEREQIKERMTMGKAARAKQGKYYGSGNIPIGYDYINGELVVNEFDAMQIKRIFTEYANGKAPYTIANELNAAGLKHKYGEWKHDTIRELLQKKTYIGFIKYKNEWYKGTHDAIISDELFNKVQDIMKQKSEEHAKHNRRAGKANSYFGGYLECACCSAKYAKYSQTHLKNGVKYQYAYYKCNSRTKKVSYLIKDPNCKNTTWKMNELDNLVFDEIKKLAIDPDYINEIKASKTEDERPKIIKAEIKKIEDQIARLMDLYTIGEMPLDLLQDRIHGLNDQKLKLETEINNIIKANNEKLSHAETVQLVQSFGDILARNNYDEIRTVIAALIEKIVIDGDNITIRWNFA